MSINTLKRKSDARHQNHHGHFSINGPLRNLGYIGQTSFGRTLQRTLARDGALRGHGSCCGQYRVVNILPANTFLVADSNHQDVVKPSVVSTFGQLHQKYRWIRRPAPFATFKPLPSASLGFLSQHVYIETKAATIATLIDDGKCPPQHGIAKPAPSDPTFNLSPVFLGYRRPLAVARLACRETAKDERKTGAAFSAQRRLMALRKACVQDDDHYNRVTRSTVQLPFGCKVCSSFVTQCTPPLP
jgi:hypothetical protein